MKKIFLILIVVVVFLFISPSQTDASPAGQQNVDMVILLDTSASVFPIYNDLLNYIIRDIISDHLRFGDTLHLISFDMNPSFIFSREINNKADIEFLVNKLFSLYPFGIYTDIISALKHLREYISRIPNNNQIREIVILTDGIHNPPYGAPYQSIIDPVTRVNILQSEIEELRKIGWKTTIVRLPNAPGETSEASANEANMFDYIESTRIFTSTSGDLPGENKRSTATATTATLTGTRTVAREEARTEPRAAAGREETRTEPRAATREEARTRTRATTREETRTEPRAAAAREDGRSSFLDIFSWLNNPLLLFILFTVLLIVISFILIIKYFSRASVRESYSVVRNDIDRAGQKGEDDSNRRAIIMKVAGQNDMTVGTSRNIHKFRTGTVKSIGGANSAYLIFLYKIPGTIASLKFDGDKYIFTPLKPELFPYIGDREIDNPLDQNIKIIIDKKYPLSIKFSEYISPLEKINALMKLTERSGLPLRSIAKN